jgi:hypothetical protein
MTPEQRALMYGPLAEDAIESEVQYQPEDIETSLASAGGGMVTIAVGKSTATVPTIAYTKILENRVIELERALRNANNTNRRMSVSLNQLVKAVQNLESQLNNKLDKPF